MRGISVDIMWTIVLREERDTRADRLAGCLFETIEKESVP